MKKYIKIFIAIVLILMLITIVLKVCNTIKESKETSKTYALSDYGVSLTVPKGFSKIQALNNSQVLYLKDDDGLIINVTELKGDFWKSRRCGFHHG